MDNGKTIRKTEKVLFFKLVLGFYLYPNGDKHEGVWKDDRELIGGNVWC